MEHFGPHQRFLMAQQLAHIDRLDATIEHVSAEITKRLLPYAGELRRLETIPGIGRRIAEIIIAELGANLGRFPTTRPLSSWAGLCPGNQKKASKRYTGRSTRAIPGCAKRWWKPPGIAGCMEGNVSVRPVPAAGSATRQEDCHQSSRPHAVGRGGPPAHARAELCGSGQNVFR
jgi:hypothetical protein